MDDIIKEIEKEVSNWKDTTHRIRILSSALFAGDMEYGSMYSIYAWGESDLDSEALQLAELRVEMTPYTIIYHLSMYRELPTAMRRLIHQLSIYLGEEYYGTTFENCQRENA